MGVTWLMKPLQENIKFMENFINIAGHELKTPLANIKLSFQILKKFKKFDENIVKDIETELTRSVKLINSLLDLASINKSFKKGKINICDVLKDVEESIDLNLVDYQKQCEDFYVNADYNHLYILIKNLLSNAVKHNVKN